MTDYDPSWRNSLTNRLRYWAIRDGVVFNFDKTVEFGIEYRPPSGIDVTDEVRVKLAASMRQVLIAALPERHRGRVVVECQAMSAGQVMEPVFDDQYENALMGELAKQDREQVERRRHSGGLRSWRYFFLVRMPKPFKSPFERMLKNRIPFTPQQLAAQLTRASLTRSHIMSTLQMAGFACDALDDQQSFELLWRYFNPGLATAQAPTYIGEATPPDMTMAELAKHPEIMTRTLREQISESDLDTSSINSIVMGNREVFCVNIRGTGTVTYPGMIEPLLTAMSPYSFYFMLDCLHEDQIERRKKMNTSALDALNAATDTSAAIGGVPDIGNMAMYEGLRDTLYTMTAEQEQVFRFGLTVVVICRDRFERETATEVCRTKLSQMGGPSVLVGTVQNVSQILDRVAPFSGEDNKFMFDVLSRNAADMLPLVAPYSGSSRPIMVLDSRMGTQTGLNPQDGTDNYGTLVIGKAGSGKTMITQKLLLSCRRAGASLMIVDQKNDYLTLVDTMEGQFVNFTPGAVITRNTPTGTEDVPVRYNAFEFPRDGNREDHLGFLMGFLAVLLGADITGIQETILTVALNQMYGVFEANSEGGVLKDPTLSDFILTLSRLNRLGDEAMSDKIKLDAEALRISLQRYAGAQGIGRFLDGPSTIDLTSEVIYFNIFAIRDDPKLKPIALMLITRLIWKRAVMDTDVKVMLVEELGVLLQIPEAAKFVNALFKLGRTYNLWPVAVSQEVRDFESAGGLINNMSQLIIAALTPGEARRLVEVLELDPAVEDLINSLGGVTGISKEYLLIRIGTNGRDGDVVVYTPTRGEYWTFTSNPEDRKERDRAIMVAGGSRVAAIRALSGAQ